MLPTYYADSSSGGVGAVIRDSDGRLLTASAKRYEYLADALTAEASDGSKKDGLLFAVVQRCETVIHPRDG
jgi:hypothetical protein